MTYANDMKHTRAVTAIALMKDGKHAGKIIANWSDNPNGSVCTATVWFTAPNDEWVCATGKAGGYGYDKFSAAVYGALRSAGVSIGTLSPGDGRTQELFESFGYQYISIL